MSVIHTALKELFQDTPGAFKVAPPGEPFTLASGKKSDYYVDCRKLLLKPRGNRLAVLAMAGLITEYLQKRDEVNRNLSIGTTGVGGAPLLGGLLFSMGAISKNSGFVIRDVQKEHGLRRVVEGHVDTGSLIILVDDVLTTGGSILKAVGALHEACGVKPHAVMVLVDREEGGAEALRADLGCDVLSVYKVKDLVVDQPATTT